MSHGWAVRRLAETLLGSVVSPDDRGYDENTRSIVVTLRTVKVDGAYSDAIADNISLTLGASRSRR